MSVPVEPLRKGQRADTSIFPVSTYREAAPHLRAPFAPGDVQFRAWQWWSEGEDDQPTHAMCVAYIDARAVIARLNLVMPDLWSEDRPSDSGSGIRTIRVKSDTGHYSWELTHWGVGEGTGKALDSDALKRAAVHLGVGESLYAVPKVQINIGMGSQAGVFLRPWTDENGKPSLKLTLAGERYCRNLYRTWLLETGIKGWGKPISHGGLADCPGRMETTEPPSRGRASGKPQKTPPERTRERTQSVAAPEPKPQPVDAQEQIDHLLSLPGELQLDRLAANAAMMGVNPPASAEARLKALAEATTKRDLSALQARYTNMPKGEPSKDIKGDAQT